MLPLATSIDLIGLANFIDPMLCYYANFTNQIQIICITNIPTQYFERVIFPGQRLLFDALPEAQLEVYTAEVVSTVLPDRISCQSLQINQKIDSLLKTPD